MTRAHSSLAACCPVSPAADLCFFAVFPHRNAGVPSVPSLRTYHFFVPFGRPPPGVPLLASPSWRPPPGVPLLASPSGIPLWASPSGRPLRRPPPGVPLRASPFGRPPSGAPPSGAPFGRPLRASPFGHCPSSTTEVSPRFGSSAAAPCSPPPAPLQHCLPLPAAPISRYPPFPRGFPHFSPGFPQSAQRFPRNIFSFHRFSTIFSTRRKTRCPKITFDFRNLPKPLSFGRRKKFFPCGKKLAFLPDIVYNI